MRSIADSDQQKTFSEAMLAAMEVSDVLLSLAGHEANSPKGSVPSLAALCAGIYHLA